MKIAFDVHQAIGTLDGPAVVDYLESPEAVFDVLKGPGTSFRPWDHQLRQPIHVVRVDQDVEWIRADVSSRIAIGAFDHALPAAVEGGDIIATLDQLGDGADDMACATPAP